MSDLFNSVKVGDTVHYSTPQGQYGKGKVVIHGGEHVVINRGKGQPQVVNDKNYVKHERGGKVIGALLSKLAAHDKYLKGVASTKASNAVAKAVSPYKKVGDPQMNASKAFGWTKTNESHVNYEVLFRKDGEKKREVVKAPRSPEGSNSGHDAATAKVVKKHGIKDADVYMVNSMKEDRRAEGPYGGHPYDWDPAMRQAVFAGVRKKVGKPTGPKDTGRPYVPTKSGPPPRRGTPSLQGEALLNTIKSKLGMKPGTSTGMPATGRPGSAAKKQATGGYASKNRKGEERKFADKADAEKWLKNEDAAEAEGQAARVTKTKHKKKTKLHELDNSTLANYVTKAIADRKKAQSGFEMAGRIHTGERKKYFQDKMFAKIDKRTHGIKTAVGKIASHLPGEPLKAHADSETSKHGGWSGMESNEVNEVSAPGKEAWIKANKKRFIAQYGKEKGLRVLYAKAWKDSKNESVVNEGERAGQARAAERSWVSDLADKSPQMSQGAGKKAPGHYLMKGGRTISGPHEPHEAVKAYKGLSDSKGVKIVHHTNEGVDIDVTTTMLSEDKVKQAAAKAISLAKKAKSNKHVDTKPRLDIVDKGTHGPIQASDEGGHNA